MFVSPAAFFAPGRLQVRHGSPHPSVGLLRRAFSPHACRIDLWITEYVHLLPGVVAIVDWYRLTGLRPFLHALADDSECEQFLLEYVRGLRKEFHPRLDGRVLFPFRRILLIAQG